MHFLHEEYVRARRDTLLQEAAAERRIRAAVRPQGTDGWKPRKHRSRGRPRILRRKLETAVYRWFWDKKSR